MSHSLFTLGILFSLMLSLVACEASEDTRKGVLADPAPPQNSGTQGDSPEEEEVPWIGPPVYCSGSTSHRWSITDETDVDLFPDALLEKPDSTSPTGRSLHITDTTARWLPGTPDLLSNGIRAMDGMSGFGTVGGVLLRFEGGTVQNVPLTAEESMTDTGWQLLDLSGSVPQRVPFEAKIHEEGQTVILWPLKPLRLSARHALVVTTDATADDGECIAPAQTTQDLLYGETLPEHPNAQEASAQYRNALETLSLHPDDISIMTVFTTHDEPSYWLDISKEADKEPVAWGEFQGCTEDDLVMECTVLTTIMDRRNAEGSVKKGTPPLEQEIPVTVWLPKGHEAPYPVVMYGHGLASHRTEGGFGARLLAEAGFAMVAMDAVAHGDHPSADPDASYNGALGFLGIDLETISINPSLLRGNFDQTNLDRRRLLRLILSKPDFDGDGVADFEVDTVSYLGVSLGAILGSQLLAVSPEIHSAVFSVGGGRLMSIVTDTAELAGFMGIITALVGSEERFNRLVPIAEHVVDPADSALWGAHVLQDRFDDAVPPSVLLQVGIDDEVVPKSAGHMLARSLGLAHLTPVAEPVETLKVMEGPLSGNGAEGASTQALFQFDRVTTGSGVGPAFHVDTPKSEEGQYQIRHFLETGLHNGVPEAIDPYPIVGTPSL